MAFARLRQCHFSAPCVWVFAVRRSSFFDLRELLIIQAKGDVLSPFGFTHLLVSNNEQSPQSGR